MTLRSALAFLLFLLIAGFPARARADGLLLERTSRIIAQRGEIRIVCYGDSISEVGRSARWHGGASKPSKNWGRRLGVLFEQKYPGLRARVFNFGIGGQNAYEGMGRLDALEAFRPDLVLVEFGTNDCCYHYLEPGETELALGTLARDIRRRFAADVMLLTTAGDNPKQASFRHVDETVAATVRAASTANVPCVNLREAVLAATGNGATWADFHLAAGNCHPNDRGHQLWAETVFSSINHCLISGTR